MTHGTRGTETAVALLGRYGAGKSTAISLLPVPRALEPAGIAECGPVAGHGRGAVPVAVGVRFVRCDVVPTVRADRLTGV